MILIIILSVITTFILIMLTYQYFARDKLVVSERLAQYSQAARQPGTMQPGQTAEVPTAQWREIVRRLGRYTAAAPKAAFFDARLMQAGLALRGAEFLVLSVGLAVLAGLIVAALAKGRILSGAVVGLAVYIGCLAYLNIKVARRLKAFNNQLPDVLEMMANALRSGFSFFQTVEMVARETTPPVSQEFGRMIREMSLGVTTEEALANLTTRVMSDDLGLVVTAVLVQRQVGGNLAIILDNISATIRERIAMKGELRSITAQGRLSGWVVGALPIFVAFMLLAINPDYINPLFSDPLGHLLIAAGVAGQLVGILVIRRIVDIDM